MSDGYDHHAASAARENASVSASQDGGGGANSIEGVDGTIGGKGLDEKIVDGIADKNVLGKGGDLNNNLMASLNGRNGDKVNPFKGLQSAQFNSASGKSIGGPGIGAVQSAPGHGMFGGRERGR